MAPVGVQICKKICNKMLKKTSHQVAWTEHHGSGKNRRTVHYRNHETYLNIKLYLIGDGKEKSKLPAGAHNFPFSITLPMNLPSTFMGAHGKLLNNKCSDIVGCLNLIRLFKVIR